MHKSLHFIATVLLCLSIASAHGQSILVKADDLTAGMSVFNKYKDYSPLSSVQLGIQAETSWTKGGGASVGKANPLAIEITKYVDGFSNQLMALIVQGKQIRKMQILWFARSGGDEPVVIHQVDLTDVFITEMMNSSAEECSSGCAPIAESYKLVYKTIKRTVYRQDDKGKVTKVSEFTWDVPAGKSNF